MEFFESFPAVYGEAMPNGFRMFCLFCLKNRQLGEASCRGRSPVLQDTKCLLGVLFSPLWGAGVFLTLIKLTTLIRERP
jgi:hypothetical protein